MYFTGWIHIIEQSFPAFPWLPGNSPDTHRSFGGHEPYSELLEWFSFDPVHYTRHSRPLEKNAS